MDCVPEFSFILSMSHIANILQRPSTKMTSTNFTHRTHHERNVICYYSNVLKFLFQTWVESLKDTLWCYMKDTYLCIKFSILERCLHYLMITPRIVTWAVGDWHPFQVVKGQAYRCLTGEFLLLRIFSAAISVSPHVCSMLDLILISMFLK